MTRRRKILVAVAGLALVGLAAGVFHGGCGTPPVSGTLRHTEYRSQRLMALAAEEAAMIPDVDTRLTRQLNLADMQIGRDWINDARTTLSAASHTLGSPGARELNAHARISGWVSVSELSRRVKDLPMAENACEQAARELRAIEDPARRCDYAMGIANELQYLKGKPAAVALLGEAGPWTRSIDNLPQRRQAVVAFASAVFNLDDYEVGQRLLRQDEDPAWRSEMLLSMASPRVEKYSPRAPAAAVRMEREAGESEESSGWGSRFYGRQLDYGSVFKDQMNSQTTTEPIRKD